MIVWPWTVTKDHVRFGAPVEEAFKNGMPGGLLVVDFFCSVYFLIYCRFFQR